MERIQETFDSMVFKRVLPLAIMVLALLGLYGCFLENRDRVITRNWRIYNDTDRHVLLKFYTTDILVDGQRKFLSTAEIDGPGLVIERRLKAGEGGNVPLRAFGTNGFTPNQMDVIFDGERMESHSFRQPLGNSIGNPHVYNDDDPGQPTYHITEENYDNAVPCDGPCK